MSDKLEAEARAVVVGKPEKPIKPKKKMGRPRGAYGKRRLGIYSPTEKSAAMAVVDFFEGNIDRSARILGISQHTLKSWRREVTAGQPAGYAQIDASLSGVMQKFTRYFDVVCALTLMKAEKASLTQMHGLVNVIGDKIIAVHALVEKRNAPIPAVPVEPEIEPEVETMPEDTEPVLDEAERQRWESIVETIMTESHVSRTAAIKSLVSEKPEAKKYLTSLPPSLDDMETEGGIS